MEINALTIIVLLMLFLAVAMGILIAVRSQGTEAVGKLCVSSFGMVGC